MSESRAHVRAPVKTGLAHKGLLFFCEQSARAFTGSKKFLDFYMSKVYI